MLKINVSKFFILLTTALSLFVLKTPSSAIVEDYIPINSSELSKRFPVKVIEKISSSRSYSKVIDLGTIKTTLNCDEDYKCFLKGIDKAGIPWIIEMEIIAGTAFAPSSIFYHSDLDNNGQQDLIVFSWYVGNGLSPTSRIKTILFDVDNRPIFQEFVGYFDTGKNAITDLVDIDNDRKAEVIIMYYQVDAINNKSYWITDIYEAENGRWSKVTGKHGRLSYPAVTRFTYRPNSTVVNNANIVEFLTIDLSNSHPYVGLAE